MAMAFSYIAKHSRIFFLCYAFVDKRFSKTCDFFSIFPAKIDKHFLCCIRVIKYSALYSAILP